MSIPPTELVPHKQFIRYTLSVIQVTNLIQCAVWSEVRIISLEGLRLSVSTSTFAVYSNIIRNSVVGSQQDRALRNWRPWSYY